MDNLEHTAGDVAPRAGRPQVLLIEDSDGDAQLVREALTECGAEDRLIHESDAQAALERLRDPQSSLPLVVLLDLNLPGMDGRAFLKALKSDGILHRVPVVVLSTSDAPGDIEHCYELGANAYLVKPADFDRFVELIRSLERFWLEAAQLPRR